MNFYKFIVAYDGTGYCGWQLQPDNPTITRALMNTFFKVFSQQATIVGASRTDAGVHALGQVAVCRTELDLDAQQLMWAWNNRLNTDIMIRSLCKVDESFHPQANVEQKTYWYQFCLERPLPIVQCYQWFVRKQLDMNKLRDCLQVFVGNHDFRSFCTGDDMGDDTIRTIDSIELIYVADQNFWRIEVKGPSFLRYMIRRIVGASIYAASRSSLTPDYLQEVLHACNPKQHLPTAPAQGLFLESIRYKS